jgi:hypothetical protein
MKIRYIRFTKYTDHCFIISMFYLILISYGAGESSILGNGNGRTLSKASLSIPTQSTQEIFQKIVKRETNWLSLQKRLRRS